MTTEQETVKTENTEDEMSLSDHLRELRNRIIVVAVVFGIVFAASLAYAQNIADLLIALGKDYGYQFVFIAPQELIMVYFQLAFVAALVVTLPLIAFEIYRFAVPALTKNEIQALRRSIFFGFAMFVAGVLFAYFISIPFMLYFLIHLKVGTAIEASISIQSFVSFLMTVFIIFGVVFEMPVVTGLLTRLGILKPQYLVKAKKIAVVVIFVIAAIITPPDIFSQTMVALPMVLLYQLSIWLSQSIYKRKYSSDSEAV